MRILDKYILKKYILTFIFTLLILVPVAIAISVSEKIGRFLEFPELGFTEIVRDYYIPFIINYGNTFMPLALFISTVFFTSKMASNTEIVAIHSAGISFKRLLKPYLIGALIIGSIALIGNHFIVPYTNKSFLEFEDTYLNKQKKTKTYVVNVSLQLSDNDIVYFRSFNLNRNSGTDFSYEHYDGLQLKEKITSQTIKYEPKDSTYKLSNYKKRFIHKRNDSIASGRSMDTTFNFFPKDLLYVDYLASEMPSIQLSKHIKDSAKRGVKNLNRYKVEMYKRTSMPVSSIILTVIAVALASRKRRGGMGINLAAGISLIFIYVFFMKISEVLGAAATYNPLFMIWVPNIIFSILAVYLYFNAKH